VDKVYSKVNCDFNDMTEPSDFTSIRVLQYCNLVGHVTFIHGFTPVHYRVATLINTVKRPFSTRAKKLFLVLVNISVNIKLLRTN